MKTCSNCNIEIPIERLEILPHTKTCVNCSTERAKVCFQVYSHKTAPELILIDGDNEEAIRLARRVHRRSR